MANDEEKSRLLVEEESKIQIEEERKEGDDNL